MTLIVTKITHVGIVFCSDRRISVGNSRSDEVTKFLPFHRLKAGMCYFGVAQVRGVPLTTWLQRFIQRSNANNLEEFSNSLAEELTRSMSAAEKRIGTGFHIAGYEEINGLKLPTFWHVSNFTGMTGFGYMPGREKFGVSEDFLQRDVVRIPTSELLSHLSTEQYIYRNGQLFPYNLVSLLFGELRKSLPAQNPRQWSIPSKIEDFALDTEFELIITEQIFKRYSRSQPIGGGIQTHVILPAGIFKFNRRTGKLVEI